MNKLKEMKEMFNNYDAFKIFEVAVTNKKTGESDWIVFDISIEKDSLIAQHVALTEKENESDKIAFKQVDLDDDFSLGENLQELYDLCVYAILDSDYFTLQKEEQL